MKNHPNIFTWAKGELSQDAIICWLLKWGDPLNSSQKELHETAKYFIQKLTNGRLIEINSVKIETQGRTEDKKRMDIVCRVNETYAILIEDKVHDQNRGNQLEIYYNSLQKNVDKENIFPVYLKTGDQSSMYSVKKAGFETFLRKDFLDVLEFGIQNGVKNHIFVDFYNHLSKMEASFQSFQSLPFQEWHFDSWKGFFAKLQEELNGNWSIITPQGGGVFVGFSWNWKQKEVDGIRFEYSIQLEQKKLCFKIVPLPINKIDKNGQYKIRDHYRKLLYPKAKEFSVPIEQNGKVGKTMTVAKLSKEYIKLDSNGFLDFELTLKGLKDIETMVNDI